MARLARQDLHRRLIAIAREQSGYFTAAQAKAVGYSYQAQRYHVERGNWLRIDRGIFRFPAWLWPVSRNEEFAYWALWSRGKGIVSHDSALALHDLGDFSPARAHLTVPPGFDRRSKDVELHFGAVDESDIERWEGFSVTTPLRSILDVAGRGADLDHLAGAISDLFARNLATLRELRDRAFAHSPEAALAVEQALQWVPA